MENLKCPYCGDGTDNAERVDELFEEDCVVYRCKNCGTYYNEDGGEEKAPKTEEY